MSPSLPVSGIRFPHACQAIRISRTTRAVNSPRWTTEIADAVTSSTSDHASPAELASWVRGHWHIENRLHWVRDVTFDEDRSGLVQGLVTDRHEHHRSTRTNDQHYADECLAQGSASGHAKRARRLDSVIELGSRKRSQPAPPHVVFEALTEPDRDPARPWLDLLDDEQWPHLVEIDKPSLVVWSSLWIKRPDARVRFDLPRERGAPGEGTDLHWTLLVAEPAPNADLAGHLRKRLNQLINENLRYTFGQ